MSKESFYFQHDYEPTSDPKIQALIGEFGAVGYGVFWRIVEMLHSNAEHKLPLKQYMLLAIAKQMSVSAEQIQAIIKYCIEVCELFVSDGEYIESNRVNSNFEMRLKISEKRSVAGRLGAIAKQNSAKLSIEKNTKEKIIIENDTIQDNITSFKSFWNTYDKEVDKEKCESIWNNLTDSERAACVEKLPAYIDSTPDKLFRKHPENYLQKRSWNNEIPSLQIKSSSIRNSEDIPSDNNMRRQIIMPPTLEEVAAYCNERNNEIDVIAFMNHYETVGWRYGKGTGKAVKDWKACVRTWEDKKKKELASRGIDRGQHPGQIMVTGNVKAEWRK